MITAAVAAPSGPATRRQPIRQAASTTAAATTTPNSTNPYERYSPTPSSSPPSAACPHRHRLPDVSPTVNTARPPAATPANKPSAETAIQTPPGQTANNGASRRAVTSDPNARRVIGTLTDTVEATRMHSAPAQNPPGRPTRSSTQNVNVASGGWADTWVVQAPGPSTMWLLNEVRKSVAEVMRGRSCRYSFGFSNGAIHPDASPSINVNEHSQARVIIQVATISRSHTSVGAARCSRSAPKIVITTRGVPQPRCGLQ